MRVLTLVLATFFFSSCGLSEWSESRLSEDEDTQSDPVYQLGIEKGVLVEKINQYEKALALVNSQIQNIDANFENMPVSEFKALLEVERTLRENLKILEAKPMQNAFGTVNKIRLNINKAKQTIDALQQIKELEPIMQQFMGSIEALEVIHSGLFAVFSEIGAALPFINFYLRIIDGVFQDYVAMQVSVANSALYEGVADYAVNGKRIDVIRDRMTLLSNRAEFSNYWEFWSSVKEGRQILKQITGENPPFVEWTCTVCTRSVDNVKGGRKGLAEFTAYIEKNATKIYVAIDELRIKDGGKAFPIFMGPQSWRTETGGSRKWRKPMVLEKLKKHRDQLLNLKKYSEETIEIIDGLSTQLIKSRNDQENN